MEKTCTKCGESKLLSEYHKSGKYGRHAHCKLCVKVYKKVYIHLEAVKVKRKAYNQSKAGKAYMKAYEQTEKRKAYTKAYRKNRRQTDPVYKLHKNLSSGF